MAAAGPTGDVEPGRHLGLDPGIGGPVEAQDAEGVGRSAPAAPAETSALDPEASRISSGSIEKDTVGEVRGFEAISGPADAEGTVRIETDPTSIRTNIDIRALPLGGTVETLADGALSVPGRDVELEAELFEARLSEMRTLVATDGMLLLGVEDAGIDKLMELANPPGTTRTVPITVRFVLDEDMRDAALEAAPLPAGDARVKGARRTRCRRSRSPWATPRWGAFAPALRWCRDPGGARSGIEAPAW